MSDRKLREYRNLYGKVARVRLSNMDIYLRGMRFGEWDGINRETKIIISGSQQSYDVSERGIELYILPCILEPDPEDIRETIINKPVHINFIITTVFELTEFNNDDLFINKYKRAMALQTRISEDIKRTLVATYGIQVLDYLRSASMDEVVDLIAMSEWMNQQFGQFFLTLNRENPIPINPRTRRVNVEAFNELLEEWLLIGSKTIDIQEGQDGKAQPNVHQPQHQAAPPPQNQKPNQTPTTISQIQSEAAPKSEKAATSNKVKTISDVFKEDGYMEEDLVEIEYNDGAPPRVKVNMDEKELVNYIKKVKPPKMYDTHPENIDMTVRKMNEVEFNGSLINTWNEASMVLFEKLQEDAQRGKKLKFQSIQDLQKQEFHDLDLDDFIQNQNNKK